jgi:uncharacterized membrane protein (DUF373 family)
MNSKTDSGRLEARFESIVIIALKLLLMIVIAIAVLELFRLLYASGQLFREVRSVPELEAAVQRGFAGVLMVVLGLELLETLRIFFTEHRVKLELILIVAIIAVGRHIILLDFQQAGGMLLVGVAALMLALTSGYYLVQRSVNQRSLNEPEVN